MTRKTAAILFFQFMLSLAGTMAVAEELPEADRRLIEASLGKEVLGPAVSAPAIDNPGRYFKFAESTRMFRIVHGPHAGTLQAYRLFSAPKGNGPEGWHYQTGDEEIGFLSVQADGSLVMTGVEDLLEEAVTRYDPPEPFLLKGMSVGDLRKSRMSVNVYSPGSMDDVLHEGVLRVTHQYLGACRLVLPAGTFDAVIMKTNFSGKVGPANLEDTEYRFFAADAGLVASIENRHVSAFQLYQSDTKSARVLAAP